MGNRCGARVTNWRQILSWQVTPEFEVGARVKLKCPVHGCKKGDIGIITQPFIWRLGQDVGDEAWWVRMEKGNYNGTEIDVYQRNLELI